MARFEIAPFTRVHLCINRNSCQYGGEKERLRDVDNEEAVYLCKAYISGKKCEFKKTINACISFEPPKHLKPTCPTCGVEIYEA